MFGVIYFFMWIGVVLGMMYDGMPFSPVVRIGIIFVVTFLCSYYVNHVANKDQ